MVSPLTIQQVKAIVRAAGVGPRAARDQAFVAFLAVTGMRAEDASGVTAHWHLTRINRPGEIVEVFETGPDLERPARLVQLEPGVRKLLSKAWPLKGVYPFSEDPEGWRAMSPTKARRVVARAFAAAGLPPQRAAARLREAFFRLATKPAPEQRSLMSDEDLPAAQGRGESRVEPKKSKSGSLRTGQGGRNA
jgi:integrase